MPSQRKSLCHDGHSDPVWGDSTAFEPDSYIRSSTMPRPPSDRVDEGFELWSTEAERNDTKTAELMGLSQSTVSYWHRTYHWDERYLSLLRPQAEVMVGVALATIRASLPAMTTRLLQIVTATKPVYDADGHLIGETYTSQDRDAIQAAKLLAQYGLAESVYDRLPTAIEAQVSLPPRAEQDLEAMSLGELRAHASRMLEATIQAVNTRPKRGRRI
jgi:hypothetical protein